MQAPILVGESLVPMIIPMLKDLGVEQEVAAYSVYKPGACFTFNGDEVFEFSFADNSDDLPEYSYNVPRKACNATLLKAAQKAGTRLIEQKVKIHQISEDNQIKLDEHSIKAASDCWDDTEPDLIVDAAGRANLIGNLLHIPVKKGPREDVALFAHVDRTELVDPGYVHNDRLEQGWGWRIPLPGCVSLGFIVPSDYADKSGVTKEQQYDTLLQEDKVLQKIAPYAQRLTPVLRYKNYQSVSDRLSGQNWAVLGDSAGFVDPIFSSGILIAMDSAYKLAEGLVQGTSLKNYDKAIQHHLDAWSEIAGYYYNGRIMTSIKVGQAFESSSAGRLLTPWIKKHISRIFSGAAATHPLSMNLLRFLVKYALRGEDPKQYEIK